MPNDKDYSKIDTQFESIKMAPAPTPGTRPGSQHNPGVCPALNTPPTEGKVKTVWYYDPGQNTPSLALGVTERIDSHYEAQVERQVIAYNWHPQDARYSQGSGAVDSTMNSPLSMGIKGYGMRQDQGTPPGDSANYGGGQSPGNGATPPGDPMSYGGGQGPV